MKKKLLATIAATLVGAVMLGLSACASPANVKVLDIELTTEEYAVAVNKEDADLLASVNELFASMQEDGSMKTLINSYFDGTSTFSYTNTTEEKAENNLVMATNAAFPPFESASGNKFVGVDIELGYKLAQKLGKTLYVKDIDFDSVILDVVNGVSDVALAGITVNAEREKQVNFSTGYYESAQVITVREDDTLFTNCKTGEEVEAVLKAQGKDFKVGTQKGTTGFMYSAGDADFGYDGFTNLTTKAYDNGAMAMKDLYNGKINAVILDKQPSLMIASSINK